MYVLILGSFLCMTQSRVVPSAFDFYFWSNERGIFFQPSLLSLNCKLSCWKPTLSFLKTVRTFTFFFENWRSALVWCQIFSFSFTFIFVLVFLLKKKQNSTFCFMEREKIGVHICFLSLKLSCQVEWYH